MFVLDSVTVGITECSEHGSQTFVSLKVVTKNINLFMANPEVYLVRK